MINSTKNNLSLPYKTNFNQLPLPHQIEKHETIARTNIKAKLIEKKRFRGKSRWHGGYILLDACLQEGVREYVVTLDRIKVDKGARRNFERRIMEHRFFYPKAVLLNMLPELSESFYNRIVQERSWTIVK